MRYMCSYFTFNISRIKAIHTYHIFSLGFVTEIYFDSRPEQYPVHYMLEFFVHHRHAGIAIDIGEMASVLFFQLSFI